MKKLFLLIFIFCMQLVPTKAQWVTITDPNFVNKLTQLYPSCMNGNQMDTTCSQIVNAISLSYYDSITDITGIQYFDNLTYLECNYTYLNYIPALPSSLQKFSCNGCQLSSLPALPLTLTHLSCGQNGLTALPSLPSSLKYLQFDYNQVTSLPTLPQFIDSIRAYHNQLTSLPVLPNSISYLDVTTNQLSTLPALPNSLKILQCSENQISALPALPSSLKILSCISNQLTSLPILPDSLTNLICGNNQLINLPGLPNSLTALGCSNNQLTSLPQLPSSLSYIVCGNNQLSNLPVLPTYMNILECNNNLLTSLPSMNNAPFMFSTFNIANNNIYCLDFLPILNPFNFPSGDISNNPLSCVPNQTDYSLGLPLCMDNDPINNPNYCTGVANITGFVFTDLDTNCIYANSDWHTENIPVKVYDGQNNLLAMSYTVNGAYSFTLLQPDTFFVKIDDNVLPFSMDCSQANNQIVPLDSANQTIQNINFPVVCDTAYDIKVNSVNSQGWVFPGQQHTLNTNLTINTNWYNLNCSSLSYSGTVSINITGPVTFIAPANNALIPAANGNTFTYNITDFSTLTPQSFNLQFLTDTTAQANDQICVHVEINPTPLDADTTNNVYDFCYQVVNSYDPNMKEVYPVNVLPGYDDWFTYTIHFQNTGNAPAFNIRLRDTLDANLDINTFEVRSYSHPAIVSVNGNNLTVRFNNIMLPDSTTDYEGSMGYFQYRIKPLPNLPLGTQIENTAYIYFDYNAPIITNTTQNNFQTVVSTFNAKDDTNQLKVFPNPANEVLNINLQNNNIENCIITNALGQTVYNSANEINGNHKIQLNIADLNAGVYFVKVRSGNGSYNAKFIKSE